VVFPAQQRVRIRYQQVHYCCLGSCIKNNIV